MRGISGLDYALSSNGHAYLTLTANLFAALLLNDTFVRFPPGFGPQTRSRAEVKAPGIIPRKSVHEPVQVGASFAGGFSCVLKEYGEW